MTNPHDESTLCEVPDGDAQDVDLAVAAAVRAFPGWASTDVRQRGRVMRECARILRAHADELAMLDAVDVGNTVTLMRMDVEFGAEMFELMADAALQLQGSVVPVTPDNLHFTTRHPFGVVARIVPFNHPVMFASQKVAAPLMAGNTVVLKPSEASPLSALRMTELLQDALPAGVLNIVVGDGPSVPMALVKHPDVRRIAFTGSERVARILQIAAAESGVKNFSLELGGKNALIVCDDANLDWAVDGIIRGMNFRGWQSQSCGSTSRIIVHASVTDEVTDRVVEAVGDIRIGDPREADTEMGPLASRAQYERVCAYIALASEEGAKLRCGGGRPAHLASGFYIEPTVFTGVRPEMRIANEEVFGPVVSFMTYSDDAEAIRIANGVPFGLTAAVFSNDITRAHTIARAMDVGYVWINGAGTHYWGMPFGGSKSSGIGREESLDELLSYTELKTTNVILKQPEPVTRVQR